MLNKLAQTVTESIYVSTKGGRKHSTVSHYQESSLNIGFKNVS